MKKQALISVLLAAFMASSAMAGCAGSASQAGQASAPSQAQAAVQAPSTETATVGAADDAASSAADSVPEAEENSGSDAPSSEADFSRTEGLWRLHGAEDTASIYMDGEGYFIAYYASGAVEAKGHMEYYDEYDNGNGRYDLIDESGEFFTGFYFDSDTQFHVGNDEGLEYIRADEDASAGGEMPASDAGVLVNTPGFTGLTPVEANNDYYGGYYYLDHTQDLMTVIVNTGFQNELLDGESMEEYLARCLEFIEESEAREIDIELNDEQSARFTYPVYYITWLTGYNEDTTDWTAMVIPTDTYTYAYAFGTDADFVEEIRDTWYESFDMIELVFPSEA